MLSLLVVAACFPFLELRCTIGRFLPCCPLHSSSQMGGATGTSTPCYYTHRRTSVTAVSPRLGCGMSSIWMEEPAPMCSNWAASVSHARTTATWRMALGAEPATLSGNLGWGLTWQTFSHLAFHLTDVRLYTLVSTLPHDDIPISLHLHTVFVWFMYLHIFVIALTALSLR